MVGREKRVSLGAYCAEGLRAGREKNCGYCSTGSELRHGMVFKFGVKCSSWELSVALWLFSAVNCKHMLCRFNERSTERLLLVQQYFDHAPVITFSLFLYLNFGFIRLKLSGRALGK